MPELFACPECRGPLTRESDALRCGCAAYPVVEGIPIVTAWAKDRSFRLEEVLARHLPAAEGLAAKILRRLLPGTGKIYNAVANREATFLDLAARLGRTSDLDYFRYRFSDLSYLSTAALLTPLTQGPVLDLGCGAGHLSSALVKRIPRGMIVGLDFNFTLVYLAKRFVAPTALFVCADASQRLPFRDGAFEAALCSDTFNYLSDRSGTARELLRTVRGPLLLSRLADPSFQARGGQAPLEPDAYLAMFGPRGPRLHLDRDVLDAFLRRRVLDLTVSGGWSNDVLTLTAGIDAKVWPGADYFVAGTELNPIYDVQQDGGALRLRRKFISERYTEVYRGYDEFLPESLTVTREQIAARDPDLVRKFVLLDLPPNYC
jgi:SAM-dependent methyltransferase